MQKIGLIEKVRFLGNEFSKKQAEADQYFEKNRQKIGEPEINEAYWDLENAALEAGSKYSEAARELSRASRS